MALYTKEEAKKLMERVLSYATADETEINLSGNIDGNIRYARNSVSTSGELINVNLAVSSSYGKRTGIATIDELDDASLKKVVARAEELAKLAPENDERMPLLGPQTEMARRFHLKNGAQVFRENAETVNYEYSGA
jgi:predicted Zn-dependent protease